MDLLAQNGITAHPTDEFVRTAWAPDARVTDTVLQTAIAKAKRFKPGEEIPLGYLDKAVQSVLQRQSAPAAPQQGQPIPIRRPQGFDPKGIDESTEDWQARVASAEAAQRRGRQS